MFFILREIGLEREFMGNVTSDIPGFGQSQNTEADQHTGYVERGSYLLVTR
jgi:hypothetical protein